MLKYVIIASIFITYHCALCEEQASSSVEVDDSDQYDFINAKDEKMQISSIVKCGLDISEPFKIRHFEDGLIGVDYYLDDIVVSNISKCDIKSIKLHLDSLDISFRLECPQLSMFCKYYVTGIFIALFQEGMGEAEVIADNYGVLINGKLQEFIGKDNQKHVKVKSFTSKIIFRGPVAYNLTNIFNGNKDLASEVLNFINTNWRVVSKFVQTPIASYVCRQVLKNINKCLKPIPLRNIEL